MGVRDPDQTQRRILDAASEEFAARGIAGARVDAIAERAGVNKRMLYYYFGSKEQLFREILRQRLVEKLQDVPPPTFTGRENRVGRGNYYLDETNYVRLVMWEALEMPLDVEGQAERAELFRRWREKVVEAQAAGEMPAHLDPAQIVLSEIALTMFPAAFPQLTRMITGMAADSPEFREARSRFLEELGELGAGAAELDPH